MHNARFTVHYTIQRLTSTVANVDERTFRTPNFNRFLTIDQVFRMLMSQVHVQRHTRVTNALRIILAAGQICAHVQLARIANRRHRTNREARNFRTLMRLNCARTPRSNNTFHLNVRPYHLAGLANTSTNSVFGQLQHMTFGSFAVLFGTFYAKDSRHFIMRVFFGGSVTRHVRRHSIQTIFRYGIRIDGTHNFGFTQVTSSGFHPIAFDIGCIVHRS